MNRYQLTARPEAKISQKQQRLLLITQELFSEIPKIIHDHINSFKQHGMSILDDQKTHMFYFGLGSNGPIVRFQLVDINTTHRGMSTKFEMTMLIDRILSDPPEVTSQSILDFFIKEREKQRVRDAIDPDYERNFGRSPKWTGPLNLGLSKQPGDF